MAFRGGEGFGGPRYGWGAVPGPGTGGGRAQWQTGRVRGPRTSPEAGVRRGEWQWRGHGPDSWGDYGWEYRGGVARDDVLRRRESATGRRGSYEPRLAEERSGGLPRGRDRFRADRWWGRLRGRRRYGYDWGF